MKKTVGIASDSQQSRDESLSKSRRWLSFVLVVQFIVIGVRFYSVEQRAERHFQQDITVPKYPLDWATREEYVKSYKKTYPRNTLVRIFYAEKLIGERNFAEAEHELWLASIDSNAVATVLGSQKMIVFTALARVQVRENKIEEALSTLARGCGHEIVYQRLDWKNPCR